MKRTRKSGFGQGFEVLESRRLFSGDLPVVQYYPEGFASDRISEYVSFTNPSTEPVEYELWARYEYGERDQLIKSGTVPAQTRSGVTITQASTPESMKVRRGVPYALELRSSSPLGANFSHYDFGTSIGEAFTRTTSTEWTFAEGAKDKQGVRGFVVFHNPGDQAVDVTLTVYGEDGSTHEYERRVESNRRGGWSLNKLQGLPQTVFGVRVSASAPVVAAMSHYEIVAGNGFGALGQAGGGATAGVINAVEFEQHRRRGRGGDDSGGGGSGGGDDSGNDGGGDDGTPDQGRGDRGGDDDDGDIRHSGRAVLSLLNTNDADASVTLRFLDREGDALNPVFRTETVVVPALTRSSLALHEMGFDPENDEFGVLYTSDLPVTMAASQYVNVDATGVEAVTVAATEWDFGEGFMARSRRAGITLTEDVYVFNPTGSEIDVTIQFIFANGTVLSVTKSLDHLEIEDVKVHADATIVGMAPVHYGIRVIAPVPVVAMLEHWDDDLGGGFKTAGTPGGTIVDLADVLVI